MWFDAGIKQPTLASRVNISLSSLPATMTCHSCANLPAAHAVSWMGNEEQDMPYPNWGSTDEQCTGWVPHGYGTPNGTRYCPAHCDAVLREHYWFWAPDTEKHIQPVQTLIQKYLTSLGRGCNMILNIAPDTTGAVPEVDMAAYKAFGAAIDKLRATVVASINGSLTEGSIEWGPLNAYNLSRGALELVEDLSRGQLIASYELEYRTVAGKWMSFNYGAAWQQTIGRRRTHQINLVAPTMVDRFRINITSSLAPGTHQAGGPVLKSPSCLPNHWITLSNIVQYS